MKRFIRHEDPPHLIEEMATGMIGPSGDHMAGRPDLARPSAESRCARLLMVPPLQILCWERKRDRYTFAFQSGFVNPNMGAINHFRSSLRRTD